MVLQQKTKEGFWVDVDEIVKKTSHKKIIFLASETRLTSKEKYIAREKMRWREGVHIWHGFLAVCLAFWLVFFFFGEKLLCGCITVIFWPFFLLCLHECIYTSCLGISSCRRYCIISKEIGLIGNDGSWLLCCALLCNAGY